MIIALSSTKGGPGKTTATACLADFFALEGRKVAVLDTDPNQNMTNWYGKSQDGAFEGIVLRSQDDEDKIIDDTEALSAEAEIVLIDVAGVASRSLLYAAGIADFVVIPCGTSEDDIIETAKTRDFVVNAAKLSRRGDIPHVALLSRVDPQTMVYIHTKVQLHQHGLRTLRRSLTQRTVYQKARFYGTTPLRFEPKGQAADDIRAVGREILAMIEHGAPSIEEAEVPEAVGAVTK
jgi:chromosome partitioning protein